MTDRSGLSRPAASDAAPRRRSLRDLLWRTWPGRVFLIATIAKLLVVLLQPLTAGSTLLPVLNSVATLALLFTLVYVLGALLVLTKRRLLWRVRRKLILSYVFVGFVPALLIVAFFLFGGLLMFFNVSSYLFKNGFDDLVGEAELIARIAASEIQRGGGPRDAAPLLGRRVAGVATRYPNASIALVPTAAAAPARTIGPVAVGPWRHLDPPAALPAWVSRGGFGGLLAYTPAGRDAPELVVRAVALPDERDPAFAVIVDVPIDDQVVQHLRETTGIELRSVNAVEARGDAVRPVAGRAAQLSAPLLPRATTRGGDRKYQFDWVTFFDYADWPTGRTGRVSMSIRVGIGEIYDRISAAQSRLGSMTFGDIFLFFIGIIGALFLVIEIVALIMGFALARSITSSVHELFAGTERVRQGDFTHRIDVKARDQLGELAESFNAMTASIEDLLQEAAEKKRLEEELRIARAIQMSLLPRGPLGMPGVAVTALCVPAREVGGDYYDFFRLGERRLGLLIADVSGKGTSAALYMAELKGLVLSLSEIYDSPRRLLIEVNRIISENLDSRSFITMTYAILDLDARSLVYARAGHTPLIHLASADGPAAQILTPDGMVLGLRLPGVAEKFAEILEEATLTVSPGDVLVFFTDGITEAMNRDADLFGESRLSRLVEEHGHLSSDELRERILREVQAFVGDADQHDDMTMILLKIESVQTVQGVQMVQEVQTVQSALVQEVP